MVAVVPLHFTLRWIYLWAFLIEVASLIFTPARDSSIPELVGDEEALPLAQSMMLGSSVGTIPAGGPADGGARLGPGDLERLATAAYLIGRDKASADAWARAHDEYVSQGDLTGAARCAFWLALELLTKGEMGLGGGWLSRARSLLEGHPECAEQGYLLVPVALGSLAEGDPAAAYNAFAAAADVGDRCGDSDLVALGRLGQGQALIGLKRSAEGVALLDELMVAVTADELSPTVAGVVYCAAIEACQDVFDLRRAQEWTAALTHWCESQPDLTPYRGQCLVHRAEMLQLHGAWADAGEEAQRAIERLSEPPD